jgi:predicted  nucleic acid-binding Zn-ribbon protein
MNNPTWSQLLAKMNASFEKLENLMKINPAKQSQDTSAEDLTEIKKNLKAALVALDDKDGEIDLLATEVSQLKAKLESTDKEHLAQEKAKLEADLDRRAGLKALDINASRGVSVDEAVEEELDEPVTVEQTGIARTTAALSKNPLFNN